LSFLMTAAALQASPAAAATAKPQTSAKPASAKPAATATAKPATAPAAGATAAPAAPPAWVQRSNANAQVVVGLLAKFAPEAGSRFGIPGLDREILDLKPGYRERGREAMQGALATLQQKLAAEKEEPVRQDLEIMIQLLRRRGESDSLDRTLMLPYYDVSGTVFQGIKVLLDDQV